MMEGRHRPPSVPAAADTEPALFQISFSSERICGGDQHPRRKANISMPMTLSSAHCGLRATTNATSSGGSLQATRQLGTSQPLNQLAVNSSWMNDAGATCENGEGDPGDHTVGFVVVGRSAEPATTLLLHEQRHASCHHTRPRRYCGTPFAD